VVVDADGNPIAGLPGTAFQLGLTGGTSGGTFGPVTETATPGTYTATFTGAAAGSASTVTCSIDGVTMDPPTVTVVPGAVSGSRSTVSIAAGTDVSGAADTVTMVVVDADGNPIAGLPGTAFQLGLTGGTSGGTFGPVAETSTPGTYTATLTGTTAGTTEELTTILDGIALEDRPSVVVTPGTVSGGHSQLGLENPVIVRGKTETLSIAVEDAAGNLIPGLPQSAFQLNLMGGASAGTFGPVTASQTPGIYTAVLTGTKPGMSSSLTATIDGVALTAEPAVTVIPGAVSGLVSVIQHAQPRTMMGKTQTINIVVKDGAGKPIVGLPSSSFRLSMSGGTSGGTFGQVTETATPGTYSFTFTGVTSGSAAGLHIAVDGIALKATPSLKVTPSPVSAINSTIGFTTPSMSSGTKDILTITVKDGNGNPINGLPSKDFRFSLTGGTSAGKFGPVTETATVGVYTLTFTGTTAGSPSTLIATVNGVSLSVHPTITVVAGAVSPARSTIRIASPTVTFGESDTLTIAVKDSAGNAIGGLPSSAFQLDLSGGTSAGTFGPVTETSEPGTYTVTFTGTAEGSTSSLFATIDGLKLLEKAMIKVNA
jgi:hypothetical protein